MVPKIRSATAGKLLICTKIARSYVARSNATLAVSICYRLSKETTFTIGSVPAEIFLILAFVARKNFAFTNGNRTFIIWAR